MSNDGEDDPASRSYQVGYRRPPVNSRFRPGQSGNPRGSPKRARNRSSNLLDLLARDIEEVLNEKHPTKDGKMIPLRKHISRKLGYRATTSDKSLQFMLDLSKTASKEASTSDYRPELKRKLEEMARRFRDAEREKERKE